MLISRLEMTRRSVGGCLSRLSRDHPILISDRASYQALVSPHQTLLAALCQHSDIRPLSLSCTRHLHTTHLLSHYSLDRLTAVSLMSPPPWDSNTSSGNPFDDIIILLMWCCYLLFVLRAYCKTSQCYSAHSTCYFVLAVSELFFVFSKVSDFMLILMNIKNKLKCENNYLIRDQKQFNFYCRDSRARALCPQTRPVPPSSGSHAASSHLLFWRRN